MKGGHHTPPDGRQRLQPRPCHFCSLHSKEPSPAQLHLELLASAKEEGKNKGRGPGAHERERSPSPVTETHCVPAVCVCPDIRHHGGGKNVIHNLEKSLSTHDLSRGRRTRSQQHSGLFTVGVHSVFYTPSLRSVASHTWYYYYLGLSCEL